MAFLGDFSRTDGSAERYDMYSTDFLRLCPISHSLSRALSLRLFLFPGVFSALLGVGLIGGRRSVVLGEG